MQRHKYKIEIEDGALPSELELSIGHILTEYDNVLFLKPSRIKSTHTPDIEWTGKRWEIKSPKGKGSDLLANTIHKATRQSENIIIDLSRIKLHETSVINFYRHNIHAFKKVKHLKIITKKRHIIDII